MICFSLIFGTYCQNLKFFNKLLGIFDVRQRQLRHKFQAHDSPIKCLALDPGEEFFATGSADGDIKVICIKINCFSYKFKLYIHISVCIYNIYIGLKKKSLWCKKHDYFCAPLLES